MIYWELFISFCQIGLLGFGGGYAILPLIQDTCVNVHGWLSATEFVDLVTISQMTPGPILINSATFVGSKIAGIPGAIIATIGSVTPSCIIVITLSVLYYKYKNLTIIQNILKILKPAVVGLIAAAGASILLTVLFPFGEISLVSLDYIGLLITLASIIAIKYLKTGYITTIAVSGIIAVAAYSFL